MNFNMILYGKDEFKINNNKIYQIVTVTSKESEDYMINIFDKFITNKSSQQYIGIDFEFNKVSKTFIDIALMQINLENDNDDICHIFILQPSELADINYKKLISLITQPELIKILHGSESLDITYIFNQLLITKENINNFCSNFYDTKYLCEYHKLEHELDDDISCNIYNLLVLYNIISESKLEELEKNEEELGPLWLIKINLYELSLPMLKYALYDVIFLPELIRQFLLPKNNIYTYLIPDIIHIIFKYKKNIESQFLHLEKLINKMNLEFIYINNKAYTLHIIWTYYNDYIFGDIKNINYFKQLFKILSKYIVYYTIYKKYDIFYKNNQKIYDINFEFFLLWLKRYTYLYNEVIEYLNLIENNL